MHIVEFDYRINDWVKDEFGTKGKIMMLAVDNTDQIMYSVKNQANVRWLLPDEITLIDDNK